MNWRPIANKYREGNLKRTLERELKVPETLCRKAVNWTEQYAVNQLSMVMLDVQESILRGVSSMLM